MLGQQQRCPSSGQKVSVSDSNLVVHKQFHSDLTERLQKLLNDRNNDPPPQESGDHRRKLPGSKRGSEETNPENLDGSVSVPKLQKAQRSKQSKEKAIKQMSTKPSDVTVTNKTVQGRKEPEVKDDTKMVISSKQKVGILSL